jgi:DNA repair photolyase
MAEPPLDSRGTRKNPGNRFEPIHVQLESEEEGPGAATPTLFYRDTSKSVLAENDSPDVGFRFSINPYRGCEHGCVYCYARPTHEYLSFSAGLDFERRILVKEDAAELLSKAFLSSRWQPQVVALSGNTDCYQPAERHFGITRRCLEVFRDFRNPVGIITKSALVTRDVDLLAELAADGAAHVFVSVTSLDAELARRLEPRAAAPERRLETIARLSAADIPVGVMVAPVIPGLTDAEIPAILARARAAGARSAGWVLLRLPHGVEDLFRDWLRGNYPERAQRVLGRIRDCRGGRLSDPRFRSRQRGEGVYAQQLAALFRSAARRAGLDRALPELNAAAFRRPPRAGSQLALPLG